MVEMKSGKGFPSYTVANLPVPKTIGRESFPRQRRRQKKEAEEGIPPPTGLV